MDKSGRYILLDGFHRHGAYQKLGRGQILCDILDAEPGTWRLLTVRFNFDSSQPLKTGEIKKAIHDTWCKDNIRDKQQIADMVGCSVQWVRRVVRDLDQDERGEKLALARKLQDEENRSIRDIADRIGWTKSKTHRLLSESQKSADAQERSETGTDQPKAIDTSISGGGDPDENKQNFHQTERIIENFDGFEHKWEPDKKEALYAFDGIKNDLSVETISKHIDKNPAGVRNTAHILLYIFQNAENTAGDFSDISETLSVGVERIRFIHWLFTHWPNTLPERKSLFQWILKNKSQYHDERINKIIRFEHLYWHQTNSDEGERIDDGGNHLLKELPAEKLSQLSQSTLYFEDLKKYIRNYKIETVLAKDLMERLNLIMISQNRIQDHLRKFV